jgi:hypothetical protein
VHESAKQALAGGGAETDVTQIRPILGATIQQSLSRPETLWIVLSNAIPIAGVAFWGWPAFSLLLFYWIENVVVGGFNVAKITIAGLTKPKPMYSYTFFLVPFFCFHYGLFCFVHGTFLLAMFSFSGGIPGLTAGGPDMFELIPFVWSQLETDTDLRLGVLALIGVLGAWFAVLWLGTGKWRDTNPFVQMIEPYGRIIVMHLTVLLGTVPVLLLGQPVIAVTILALLKCAMDLGLANFAFGAGKFKDLRPDEIPKQGK